MNFNINTTGTDYFVGDLHGEYKQFMDKIGYLGFDFDKDRMFSVGDLIDRGPDSVGCLDLLTTTWFHAVRGNHEELMLGSHGIHIWYQNGGQWADELMSPELDYYKNLVAKLPYTNTVDTEFGTIGVVHAESRPDWGDNNTFSTEENTWARRKIKKQNNVSITGIDRVVVGHTPLRKIVKLGNVIYIDTGAVFDSGFMTILSAEEVFKFKDKVGL